MHLGLSTIVLILSSCKAALSRNLPDCGVSKSSDEVFPWNVGIYYKNNNIEFLCTGTVIAQRVILTAAQCFYDEATGTKRSGTFIIVAGKSYKEWNNPHEQNLQMREITEKNIVLGSAFHGASTNYLQDVAVIKLEVKKKLHLNDQVQKVCIDWANEVVRNNLKNKPVLNLSGWKDSKTKKLASPAIEHRSDVECENYLPTKLMPFLTNDKSCAQINSNADKITTGNGVLLKTHNGQWYLLGVNSIVDGEDSKNYLLYVKLNVYLNWLANTSTSSLD